MFVVPTQTDSLLSREAASRLGLIQRLDAVEDPLYSDLSIPIKCKPVHITLAEGHTPYSVHTARRVPIPLLQKVKEELQRLKEAGVIEEIQEPTDWCAPMVPVLKRNNSVRICTDYKQLNKAVKRERYMLPTLDDILHKLRGAKVFSKLDATSGFFQLPLDEESSKLTAFMTPCGRFIYRRLPQGITSAPEIFQRTVEGILCDQPNTVCFFDDILIFSNSEKEHEGHLQAALKKLRDAGLKLNRQKCEFSKREIEFLGYIISGDGIKIDPAKIEAITKMPDPTNVAELRRFLGMVNFLGRHLPNLSQVLHPLNKLLEKDTAWTWSPSQQNAVQQVRELITNATVLAFYSPEKPTIVSADASSFGIGGVLLQQQEDGSLRPVAYCSRTLSPAEQQYAQIEKECLASVWVCERFDRYLVGLPSFTLETDHKPLVPLINNKDLSDTPLRCQRMLMRLARFSLTAKYTQGKNMHVADALSRAPLAAEHSNAGQEELHADVIERVDVITSSWPTSDAFLQRIRDATQRDVCLQMAIQYTLSGWPEHKEDVKLGARNLYAVRGELSVWKGLLIKGERIVIPHEMQKEILERIHEGHLGINKCRERANQSVWWPHISKEIKDCVSRCRFCLEKQPTQRKEPLLPSDLPDRPFQRIAIDLCEYRNTHFLVSVDYYSRYLDICRLPNLTSRSVIMKMQKMFAQHGVPETVVSDNGTQFTSAEFKVFSKEWNFCHVTTSPHNPQANGAAERAVHTAKDILKQKEVFQALLVYRSTPIPELGASPAELAYGRKLRTTLPVLPQTLSPKRVNQRNLRKRDNAMKKRQKSNFDVHHGVRSLPQLQPGQPVVLKLDGDRGWKQPAEVVKMCAPRSYLVRTPDGSELRRNRRNIRPRERSPTSPLPPLSYLPPPPTPQSPVRRPQPSQSPTRLASLPRSPQSPLPTSQPQPQPQQQQPSTAPNPAAGSSPYYTRSGRLVVKPTRYRE
jgi:transposase InsO family protein